MEMLEQIEMEDFLDYEGVDYIISTGSSGVQLNVRECPFCGNSRSKVYISQETGLGNCFAGSCEKGTFNKWGFIQASIGLSNSKTFLYIKRLAQDVGWRPKREAVAVHEPGLLQLPSNCLKLPINGRNLKYLDMRLINMDLVRYFSLRYAHKSWFTYRDWETGEEKFQLYERRVIVPIYDMQGKMVSFQGRDITNTSDKKYLFPPGFASTGVHLFNGQNAIPGTKRVILAEGVFDVISAKKALDTDVNMRDVIPLGTFGKHLSNDQFAKLIQMKRNGLEEVTIMWDGEKVAISDAIKTAAKIVAAGLKARVAFLPAGRDPNDITVTQFLQCFRVSVGYTKTAAVRMISKAHSLYI